MRVHIGDGDDPIEIVVLVDVGVLRKPKVTTPASEEAAPEEIADRNSICLFVAQSLVHSLQLRKTYRTSLHAMPSLTSSGEGASSKLHLRIK